MTQLFSDFFVNDPNCALYGDTNQTYLIIFVKEENFKCVRRFCKFFFKNFKIRHRVMIEEEAPLMKVIAIRLGATNIFHEVSMEKCKLHKKKSCVKCSKIFKKFRENQTVSSLYTSTSRSCVFLKMKDICREEVDQTKIHFLSKNMMQQVNKFIKFTI